MSESIHSHTASATATRIEMRTTELGDGLTVRRALPTRELRMVGGWCFLDHIGPIRFAEGAGLHIGAHPHTALQTFTWMMAGELLHRDSLGSEQRVSPGQVNLMTAGHGISHTEDTPPDTTDLHAAQLWIALPPDKVGIPPAFEHYPTLPGWSAEGLDYVLLVGEYAGYTAPTRVYSPLLGLDVRNTDTTRTSLPLRPDFEYAILPLTGALTVHAEAFSHEDFIWLGQGRSMLDLDLAPDTHFLLLGGAPFETPIQMWWNFVGYSRHAIAQAQAEWEAQSPRFGTVAGGETRRIQPPPLPWSI
jgi:redox-sensitive bicupin YhaK (pirin superfamily)